MRIGKLSNRRVGRSDKVRARELRFTRDRFIVVLSDGRELALPLDWYPTLRAATAAQRARWRLLGNGTAFHWPDLDLDLSLPGVMAGLPELIPPPPPLAENGRTT